MSEPAPAAGPKRARRRASRGTGEQLRAEIVAATKELLARAGSSEAVSIRAVADAVGVTSPSIYLHFADKDELIEAVVADVFAELDAAMVAATRHVDEPLDKLCTYGLAYVQFALEHPEHYRIATMNQLAGKQAEAGTIDHVLADSAFAHLMATVRACMAAGVFTEGDPLPTTLELWSAAHGIASLMISKPFLPWGDKLETAARVLRSAALGHAVSDVLEGEPDPARVQARLAALRAARAR